MRATTRLALLSSLSVVLAACGDAALPPTEVLGHPSSLAAIDERFAITAMTRNLYIGADVFPVFAALATPDPTDDLPALLAAVAQSQETAFPVRVQALADEIARARPHVLGLQEVSDIEVRLPSAVVPPAGVEIRFDYLALLLDALAERGLHYVVARAETYPGVNLAPAPGIVLRNEDRDVLLIDADRARIVPGSAFGGQFANNVGAIGGGFSLTRGYVGARIEVDGTELTVVNTHLEALVGPQFSLLRAAQISEVVTAIGNASPALVIGDLNDGPGTPMHDVLLGAGFRDAWADMRPGVIGFTCCHLPGLSNTTGDVFSERIDYVMARALAHENDRLLGSVTLYGTTPGDRVQGPARLLWPSDHAGLSARLFIPHGVP